MNTINKELFSQQSCNFKFLAKEGFNTPKYYELNTYEDCENLIIDHLNTQEDLGIDGFIQQIEGFDLPGKQEVFFSYDDVYKSTLNEIRWIPNPTGEIIPIAVFDLISIDGKNYSSCSLRNVTYLEKLITSKKMMIGDEVFILLKDDNIPIIIGISVSNNIQPIEVPTNCPTCDSDLILHNHKFICASDKCSVKVTDILMNYVGLLNNNIFTEKLLFQLVKEFNIVSISDLKELTIYQINHLKDAETIINILNTKPTINKQQLINLTQPKNKGLAVIGYFMNEASLELLLDATTVAEQIIDVSMVDESSRTDLINTINTQLSTIRHNNSFFNITDDDSNKLHDLVFCLTNTMTKDTMKNYEKRITENGGRIGTVTKKLNFLVTNKIDNTKYKKVVETNTKLYNSGNTHTILVIDEYELVKMMEK